MPARSASATINHSVHETPRASVVHDEARCYGAQVPRKKRPGAPRQQRALPREGEGWSLVDAGVARDLAPDLDLTDESRALRELEELSDAFDAPGRCCRARMRLLERNPVSRLVLFGVEGLAECPRCAVIVGVALGIASTRAHSFSAAAWTQFADSLRRRGSRQTDAKVIASAILAESPGMRRGSISCNPRAVFNRASEMDSVEPDGVTQNDHGDWQGKYAYWDSDGQRYEGSARSVHQWTARLAAASAE